VPTYKYLGINLTTTGKLGNHLAQQLICAKKGLNTMWNNIFKLKPVNMDGFFKFFDAVSRSIMCYSAQVWGYQSYDDVEKIQRFFIKKLMKLPYNTPNYMVLLEFGRDPLYVFTLKLHFSYILKICDMHENRFPKIMCKKLLDKNIGWCKVINNYIIRFGINNDLSPLTLANFKVNMNVIYDKIVNQCKQDIQDKMILAQYHKNYFHIKHNYDIEPYLSSSLKLYQKQLICKTRMEMLPLNYRPWLKDHDNRCPLCILQEDESIMHFIADCPLNKEFRQRYFNTVIILHSDVYQILNNSNWLMLANFIQDALNYRRILLNEF
jgi:hypothetical protein